VSKAAERGKDWSGLLFILPFLLVYLVILIYPLLKGMSLSMQRVDLFGEGTFVGLENYGRLFADASFVQAVLNTFKLALIIVPLLTVFALALALALNRATKGAAVFRGIFFSSSVLSVTIVTLIWRFVLAPDAGLLGEAAKAMGSDPIPFLSHPTWSLWALAIATIWWSIGLPMMLFLAGLQQIPGDVYEAARVDGANVMQRFFRITMPLLKGTILVAVLFRTLDSYRIFDLFWAMSNRELESLSTFVYKSVRVSQLLFAQGNAASVFIFITSFLLALFFIYGLGMQTSTEE